jgi:BNR/Asp-box repeat protein
MQRNSRRLRQVFALAAAVALFAVGSAVATVGPTVRVSPIASPFGGTPGGAVCQGQAQTGTNNPGAEVEPFVDVNLTNANNLVGAWQQDRWSNGGSTGQMSAYSTDGGQSWTTPPISAASNTGQAKFSRCTGGNAANGGDYERATDPWVSFSPNGVVQQISLGINDSNVDNAVIASRSEDRGKNWDDPVVIKRDNQANFFNDKESLTANPHDSHFVYATWQRIVAPSINASARAGERAAAFRSFAWFARSDDNGVSYATVKPILDPGNKNQTIGNQIVVLPNGDLVMLFNLIRNTSDVKNRGFTAEVMRSTDNGDTWSNPIVVDRMFPAGVTDPEDGHGVRTGDLNPEIAVDNKSGSLYVVWQDSRFTGNEQVAMSKSEDGGLTWGPTKRVSTVGGTNQAFTPMVRVADDGNADTDGTVGVQYYDFRNDSAATPGLTTDTWIIRSTDGGATFPPANEEAVGDPYDMRQAPEAGGYFVGDYEGLDWAGGGSKPGFKPFFVRSNNAMPANRTDVFATTASTSP